MRTRSAMAALAACLTFSPAHAQNAKIVLGTLTCTAVEGEVNRFASNAVVLSCDFRATEGGYAESYVGTLRRTGEGRPIDGSIVLIWTVSGDAANFAPGILEQSYTSTRPAADPDPDSRQLHGQRDGSIVLRPFVRAEHGIEPTVTALDLDLKRTRA
ncbi:MAG: DUF992 domain-containing protein [Hyphomicrobiaceae bacterium]|nr:DUF992 domain-containing protein [Hyphomicrobiaceae bacterium]